MQEYWLLKGFTNEYEQKGGHFKHAVQTDVKSYAEKRDFIQLAITEIATPKMWIIVTTHKYTQTALTAILLPSPTRQHERYERTNSDISD